MSSKTKYKSSLSDEIRMFGDLLSDDQNSSLIEKFIQWNPDRLLHLLKTHRLYPVFYKLFGPDLKNGKAWEAFSLSLKKLVQGNNLQMLHKTSVLVKVTEAFDKENIPLISLKGPVLAKLLHGDLAGKASIDLDIFIREDQFEHAVKLLCSLGFQPLKFSGELNQPQRQYLLNHFHHLGFYHPEEKVPLELHWHLNTNKYLLKFKFDDLYARSVSIPVGGQLVRIFSPSDLAIFLMVHGSYHAWARLDWLFEFSLALRKYSGSFREIEEECKKRGLDRLFSFSTRLSNLVFQTDFPEKEMEGKENELFRFCIRALNQSQLQFTGTRDRLRYKFYLSGFKRSFRYKAQVWLAMRTNPPDWQTIRLPERLFFLYYFLRPVLYFIGRRKPGRNTSK